MINPFYRYISPVQDFLEAAKVMNHHSVLLSASLDCAIHVLYDGIDILGCALENFRDGNWVQWLKLLGLL